MNWLDLLVVIIVIIMAIEGFFAGMVRKIAQIAGIIAGLLAATYYYAKVSDLILEKFAFSEVISDISSYAMVFIIVYAIVSIAGKIVGILVRFAPVKAIDRLGGASIGLIAGFVISGAVILLMTTFSIRNDYQTAINESFLGKPAVIAVEEVYSFAENSLLANMPRIAYRPESDTGKSDLENKSILSSYMLIDFSSLKGAICIQCGGELEYLGYQKNKDDNISPKFICHNCGRTSDGCQSFEGHHLLYDRCPEIMGLQGYRTDCGIWPNDNFIRVTISCPVCKEKNQ